MTPVKYFQLIQNNNKTLISVLRTDALISRYFSVNQQAVEELWYINAILSFAMTIKHKNYFFMEMDFGLASHICDYLAPTHLDHTLRTYIAKYSWNQVIPGSFEGLTKPAQYTSSLVRSQSSQKPERNYKVLHQLLYSRDPIGLFKELRTADKPASLAPKVTPEPETSSHVSHASVTCNIL